MREKAHTIGSGRPIRNCPGHARFLGILACLFAALQAPALGQTIHPVTGSAGSRLPEAASAIQGGSGGTHIVEFSAYTNAGSFFLEGGSADTIIFRRKEESVQSLPLAASALFTFKSFPGTVVFRGLSFRADSKSSWLLNGSETGKANGSLIFDSCQIFTNDSLNSANAITWLGAANSKITFKRTFLVARFGASGMDLLADTIAFDHAVINASMTLTANVRKFLALTSSTLVRAQITSVGQPPGSSTATVAIRDNLFLHPAGGRTGALNLLLMGDVAVDSLKNNARDPAYTRFDQGSYNASFSSGNNNVVFSGDKKDPSELWNWDIAGETSKGAYNPAGPKAIPRYNILPGGTLFAKRLSGKDSIRVALDSAELPRLIDANYASGTAYPAALDTVRSFWLKDTALIFSGPATIKSIELPLGASSGLPLLYSNVVSTFVAGTPGAEGSLLFANGSPASKSFIPSFGGQNTLKGSAASVKGLSSDTALIFSAITRTGRTRFLPNTLTPANRRWRIMQKSGTPFGFRNSTNAEGSGTILFGLSKAGADAPFFKDSLQFWLGGAANSNVTDSGGKYWGRTAFAADLSTLLIERLAVGAGRDTLSLPQGKVLAASAGGHQFSVDSSFSPTQSQFPDMGSFTKGLSPAWPGRAAGDTLLLELRKSAAKQKAFLLSGGKAVELTPAKEDSATLTLSFGVGDSGKPVFLARRYSIPAGTKTNLALGKDSVADLLSTLPGEYRLDTGISTSGLALDTFRVWANRRVITENLSLQASYALWVDAPPPIKPERVSAFILSGAKWDTASFKREGSRYRINVPAGLAGLVIAEKLEPIDTLPIYPQTKPAASVQAGNLLVKPSLSTEEKARLQAFHVEVAFLDPSGRLTRKSFQTSSPDTTVAVAIPSGSVVIFKAGYESRSGKITWDPSFVRAEMDSRPFLEAVNASAPSYQSNVWELVGFPQDMSLTRLLSPIGAEAPKSIIRAWNGSWQNLAAGTTLAKGRGYLLGVTQPLRPALDASQPFQPKADSVALDTGWQLVSNPLPVPITDAALGLDSSSVSYFYSVQWQGKGKDAKHTWVLADTLQPFKGYAVRATKPGRLVFNPLKDIGPLAKQSATERLTLTLNQPASGGRALVYFRPHASSRASMGLGFLRPDFQAYWLQPDGPMIQGDSLQTDLLIKAPVAGPILINPNREAGNGKVFALWGGRKARLEPFQGTAETHADAGWNTFKVFEIAPEEIPEIERRLRSMEPGPFRILSVRTMTSSQGFRLSLNVPGSSGAVPNLRIQILDVMGRAVDELSTPPLLPGIHAIDLPSARWTRGILFARVTLTGGRLSESATTKLLNTGGNR